MDITFSENPEFFEKMGSTGVPILGLAMGMLSIMLAYKLQKMPHSAILSLAATFFLGCSFYSYIATPHKVNARM